MILKGGVSSGLIYPEFIFQIRKAINISGFAGSSAGAIAAALGACAEYAWKNGDEEAYEKYANSVRDLTKNLISLFDPSLPFRALFKAILLIAPGSGRANYIRAIMCFAPTLILGSLIAFLISWLTDSQPIISSLLVVLGAFFALIIHIVSLLILAARNYNFGICKGLTLSKWLENAMCEISNNTETICFHHFEEAGIKFRLAITHLNNGCGLILPTEKLKVKFEKSEFAKIFPQKTMLYLESLQSNPDSEIWELPLGPKMPILVALRISSSCPALFEQIPVYSDGKRVFLSDGGICMNFPHDIFKNEENENIVIDIQTIDHNHLGERVWNIKDENSQYLVAINGLFSYVWELIKTMREGHAKHQIYLLDENFHCFRIGLKPNEGGMNLSQNPSSLEELMEIGRDAGAVVAKKMGESQNENC